MAVLPLLPVTLRAEDMGRARRINTKGDDDERDLIFWANSTFPVYFHRLQHGQPSVFIDSPRCVHLSPHAFFVFVFSEKRERYRLRLFVPCVSVLALHESVSGTIMVASPSL